MVGGEDFGAFVFICRTGAEQVLKDLGVAARSAGWQGDASLGMESGRRPHRACAQAQECGTIPPQETILREQLGSSVGSHPGVWMAGSEKLLQP